MTNFNASSTETRTSASTYFTFDHFDKKIVGSELNFKKSGIPGSSQYNALMEAMAAHPNYALSAVAPKKEKQTYKGLTFDLIMDYVYTCGDETTKEEFDEIVSRNEGFQPIKSWFLDYHKANFSVEKIKNEIKSTKLKEAQAKLTAKKADVRKVVKARLVKASPSVVEMPTAQNF